MSLPTDIPNQHQTAVVVDVRSGISPTFDNRYHRLLQSLGGEGNDQSAIKVNVFTLRGNKDSTGPALVHGAPDTTDAPEDSSDIDLRSWAADAGFNTLVVVVPTQDAA